MAKNKSEKKNFGKEKSRKLPEPTLTYWKGLRYTQRQLSGMVVKETEHLYHATFNLNKIIGDNPFADLRFPGALADALDHLNKARVLLDIVILCQDTGKEEKSGHEKQEEEVDKWKDDFKKEYEKQGEKCKERQKFDGDGGYWYWVKTFMINGKYFVDGWLDTINTLLEKVNDKTKKEALRKRLVALGRRIIAEVSKDNECRKIVVRGTSPSMKDWGDRLKAATDNDNGDGKEMEKEIDKIEKEVDAALK